MRFVKIRHFYARRHYIRIIIVSVTKFWTWEIFDCWRLLGGRSRVSTNFRNYGRIVRACKKSATYSLSQVSLRNKLSAYTHIQQKVRRYKHGAEWNGMECNGWKELVIPNGERRTQQFNYKLNMQSCGCMLIHNLPGAAIPDLKQNLYLH